MPPDATSAFVDLASADAATVAERLARLTDELTALGSLAPGPDVDRLFSEVVRTVTTTPGAVARQVGAHPGIAARVDRLRDLSARGECELEAYWSHRVAAADDPVAELGRFPYRDNYRDLVAMELHLLRRHLGRRAPRSVVVLGCGPLPLTATGYAHGLGTRAVGVDRDPAAVAAARRLLEATRDPGTVVVHDDAAGVPLLEYDLVVLAALVGTTTTAKVAMLRSLADRMRPGALLLARSAHGLRALLYPEIDPATMTGFDVLDVKHPAGDVINSMIVARRV
ncbi:nicotianamine synthase family protein [Myceligenerans xiligouense]|uniref:Nicotianamine synthase n=1 Tax=Myceligenerans xiligouense TaxID=253184 RepID=A0A3N4ZSE1_9MICO|nr:nicotianamine synthase family protein [Myceligenerans xiligouense]RPF22661.1 nicotianamine synthase [Myceligenerans xiligouense]